MKLNRAVKYNSFYGVLLLLYALTPVMPSWYNQAYLFALIPVLFIISIITYPSYIKDDKMILYYIVYFIFSLFTIIWAVDTHLSYEYLRFYTGTFFITYVFASFSTNKRYLKYIPLYYFIYFVMCLLLGYSGYGFGAVDVGSERVGGEGLNANRFGYFVFIITFFMFYLGEMNKNNKFLKYIFFLTIPLTFYIAIITASRQLFIIQVPFIGFLLLWRYTGKISFSGVVFLLIVFLLVRPTSDRLLSVYNSSLLAERMNMEIEDDTRTTLIKLAFQIGNDHFFTGVGLSNFRHYSNGYISHCSYAEAYAEGGIIQLFLFVMIIVSFCKYQIKRYTITKDRIFTLFFVAGLFYAAFNFFYVFQSFGTIMAFIFIMESMSKIRYQEQTN